MRALTEKLHTPTTEIALISVNGTAVDEKYEVRAGDIITIYPLLAAVREAVYIIRNSK